MHSAFLSGYRSTRRPSFEQGRAASPLTPEALQTTTVNHASCQVIWVIVRTETRVPWGGLHVSGPVGRMSLLAAWANHQWKRRKKFHILPFLTYRQWEKLPKEGLIDHCWCWTWNSVAGNMVDVWDLWMDGKRGSQGSPFCQSCSEWEARKLASSGMTEMVTERPHFSWGVIQSEVMQLQARTS